MTVERHLFLFREVPLTRVAETDGGVMRPPTIPARSAFVDANVVVMRPDDRVLPHCTVLVENGRVVELRENGSGSLPPGTRRIDAEGMYLMPGLADMHVHLWNEAMMLLLLLNGVTTVRNMWGSPRHLVWRDAVENGRLLGPTLYTSGPIVDGVPPVWNGTAAVATADEARAEVRRQKAAGYSFVKVYNNLSAECYGAIVEEARAQGLPVAGHVPTSVGLEGVLHAGQRSAEHLDGWVVALQPAGFVRPERRLLYQESLRLLESVDERQFGARVAEAAHSDTWHCPTLTVHESFVPPEDVPRMLRRPEMGLCPPDLLAEWDPSKDPRVRSRTPEDWAGDRRANEFRRRLVRELRNSGARLLLGTDTPNPFVVPGFSIHEELDRLVACGLTPYEALRAGTADAAEFLGASSEFGWVESGRRADLLLLAGNPLEDIANVRRPVGVMTRGCWLGPAQLDRIAGMLVRSYSAAPDRIARASDGFPSEDRSGESYRYRISSYNVVLGEERVVVRTRSSGAVEVRSRLVQDAPPGVEVADSRWILDRQARVRAFRVDLRFLGGRLALGARRVSQGYALSGGVQDSTVEFPTTLSLTSEALVGPIQTASFWPLARRLSTMNRTEPGRWPVLRLASDTLEVVTGDLAVKRSPEPQPPAGPSSSAVGFDLEETWRNGVFPCQLALTPAGQITRFSWTGSTSEMVWELLPSAPKSGDSGTRSGPGPQVQETRWRLTSPEE